MTFLLNVIKFLKILCFFEGAGAAEARGRVVYWMSRDQRLCDNWALLKAQEEAKDAPLAIVFCLSSAFPDANIRSLGFMLRGLKLLQTDAANLNIPLIILRGRLMSIEEVEFGTSTQRMNTDLPFSFLMSNCERFNSCTFIN